MPPHAKVLPEREPRVADTLSPLDDAIGLRIAEIRPLVDECWTFQALEGNVNCRLTEQVLQHAASVS